MPDDLRPGSDAARERGCTCTVEILDSGSRVTTERKDCPLHGWPDWKQPDT